MPEETLKGILLERVQDTPTWPIRNQLLTSTMRKALSQTTTHSTLEVKSATVEVSIPTS